MPSKACCSTAPNGRKVYEIEVDGEKRLVYEGHDGRLYDYNDHSMTYPGLTKERDADFRNRIDEAEARGDVASADDLRFERYKESKGNLGEEPLDRDQWQQKNDQLRENQRIGRESENSAREELSRQLGEDLSDNNTGDTCKMSCGDNNSRPDSISDNYVHEHKHLGGENQTVYNTQQMDTQRKAALGSTPPRQHIVTISSGKGIGADGKPAARPSGPLGKSKSTVHFYDATANRGTGGWEPFNPNGYGNNR